MLLIIDFDGFEEFEKLGSRVPSHPRAALGDEVAFEGGYRNAVNCCAA